MSQRYRALYAEWQKSVHAAHGVSCQDCHGGNPKGTLPEAAHAPAAGFRGVPRRRDIPALCARCHSDPDRMRPYKARTDQLAEYRTSVHGKRLFGLGDERVAVCSDCHGAHGVHGTADVAAPVYKKNIAATCARCHSDKTHMKGYNLPTNQFEDYRRSVHGKMLLEGGDLSAPSCTDCHGFHGAAPPGAQEVADTCGQCHAQTEAHFRVGPHWHGLSEANVTALARGGRARCRTCHDNHATQPARDSLLTGAGQGECGSCHKPGSKGYDAAHDIAAAIREAEMQLRRVEEAVTHTEAMAVDLSGQRPRLDQARTGLTEARAVQHTVSVEQVRERIEDSLLMTRTVRRAVDNALAVRHGRRFICAFGGVLCLCLAALLQVKRRQLRQRDEG